MVASSPPPGWTPPARAVAAIIALVAWAGLAVQFAATLADKGSAALALWTILRFFTITTNALVALLFSGIACGRSEAASPSGLGGVTIAILLVGIVYALLLRGLIALSGGAALANILLHMVTPILVPSFWLMFAPKGYLRARDPLLWVIYPVGYLVYALARAWGDGIYAYPFINIAKYGGAQVALNILLIGLGLLLGGWAMVRLDRTLAARLRPFQ